MAYYGRGDYYGGMQGDYYRGDPFLGVLGGIAAKGAGKALGWLTKGKLIGQGGGREALKRGTAVAAGTAAAVPVIKKAPAIIPEPVRPAKEWPDVFQRKKYRRMNPLNPRALRRALRRAEGFEKFARRTVTALYRGQRKFKKCRTTTSSR